MVTARRLTSGPAGLALAGWAAFWFSWTAADPDLWGHVRFGQDILRAGDVVRTDPYSYRTDGQPWINHEWLSEVAFAASYDHAGPVGLVALKLAVSLAIAGLGFAHLCRRGLGPAASALLLVVLSVPFRFGLGTIRPQIFTYIGFLLVLLALEAAGRGRSAWLWGLPALFAAWINLHGGVLAGVGTLAIGRLALAFDRRAVRPADALAGVSLLTLSGLALLANPYGWGLVAFLLRTATVPRPEISEWTPIDLASFPGRIYLGLLAVGIAALAASRRRRSALAVAVFAVAAILPLMSNRHYPLFALALVVMTGEHLADMADRRRLGLAIGGRWAWAAGSLMLLAGVGLAAPRAGCIRVEPRYFAFPAKAVALLKRAGVRGNAAVPFAWGEYVLWHLGPGVKVSIDGRRETVYSEEYYAQSVDFERGTGLWDALLRSGTTDLVLAPNGSPTFNLMARAEGWLPLHQDTFCTAFVREDFEGLDSLRSAPVPALPDDGGGLCFPAP